jgi:MSHA pilin protein MshA
MRRDIEQGFTVIEFVVVITILGILAAFAVPRFVGVEAESREAAVNTLAGSVRSAAMLTHAMWMAQGGGPAVAMEGATITMTHGYPNRATIDDSLIDLAGYSYAAGTGVFTRDDAKAPAECSVTYAPPAVEGGVISVRVITSGC